MQFLDSIGLASFWEKIKSFVSNAVKTGVTDKMGVPNGVATLGSDGRVPASQLPAYVDDVKEFDRFADAPSLSAINTTAVTDPTEIVNTYSRFFALKDGKYYVKWTFSDADKNAKMGWEKFGTFDGKGLIPYSDCIYVNKQYEAIYRWSGSSMVEISKSISLGETSSTAYAGDKGKKLADKLAGIEDNANNYSLPTASVSTKGGVTLGYAANGKNYPVALDGNGKAYVNVPWTDTNTTYDLSPYAKSADVNNALAKKVDVVSGKGLSANDFTAAYKTKLDGVSSGATADSAIPTSVIDALS